MIENREKNECCVDVVAYIYLLKPAWLLSFSHPIHPNPTSNDMAENLYFRFLPNQKFCGLMGSASNEAHYLAPRAKGRKIHTMTHTNTLTLTPEELSALIANATAQAVAQALSRTQAPVQAQAHTPAIAQAQTPVSEPTPVQARTYEHVSTGFDNFVVNVDKKFVLATVRDAYTLVDAKGKKSTIQAGTALSFAYGHKDAWDAFKARMRNAGGTYVPEGKVWMFPSAKAAKAFAEGEGSKPITVEELNAVRDRWTRKAEKRANKAE